MSNSPSIDDSPAIDRGRAPILGGEPETSEQDGLPRLLDLLPDAILSVDRGFRLQYANRAARERTHGRKPYATGVPVWDVYPELAGDGTSKACDRVLAGRGTERVESYYAPDDTWSEVTVTSCGDGLFLQIQDVSARKRAEASQESAGSQHASLASLAEGVGLATFELDLETNLLHFGPGSQSVGGHALEQLTDLAAVKRILHPEHQGQLERDICRAIEVHEPFISEYRTVGADSQVRWVEARGHAVHRDGLPTHVRGIFIDIGERKRAQEARDHINRQFEQVSDAASDGILSVDRSWTMTYLNREARRVLNHFGDLVGKNIWAEFPKTVGTPAYFNYCRTMEDRIPVVFDVLSAVFSGRWLTIESRPSEDGIVIFFRDISERKLAEQTMRDQQALLAIVQRNAKLATWQHDLQTQQITFGEGSYPIYGRPFEDVSSLQELVAIVQPQYRESIGISIQKAVSLGEPFVNEFPVDAPDGRVVWIESRASATYENGRAACISGIALDVTERKRTEQALEVSERRYRVLADLNPQALWAGEPDGSVTYANQFFLDYIGRAAGDLVEWINCFDPLDRERVVATWMSCVATGVDYDITARLIRASDGASRWWHLRAAPVRDESGAVTSWLGVSLDIHDIRSATEALRLKQEETERQRAELETVYRTTPVALALFDPVEFRFLRINERGAEIMGMAESELVGRKLTDVPHVPNVPDLFRQVAQGASFRDLIIEGELPNRPGDYRVWNVNYFPVCGSGGEVEAIATASLDITNQKRSEAALVQSEKLAAVGRLASSISHEINNPLEAVTNLLYLIATCPKIPPEIAGYVHSAQAELSRVSQIATQTLRFHRQSFARTRITARELVNAVISLYSGRLANSNIRVETRFDTDCTILCFENDMRQVLNNLIANAIDAMRTGGRLLARAHLQCSVQGTLGVRITIADTGHGMTKEVSSHIFEPFYTTKGLNGTGLGMWISSGIVDRHGGALRVRSSAASSKHGTVFSLLLPCDVEPAEA